MNKFYIILFSIICSLCIGSIYSWSIFILPIQELTQFSLPEIQLIFCLAIFMLGTTTSLGSSLISSFSPRIMAIIGSSIFSGGMILTGYFLETNSILLYLSYSILVGIGTGIMYLLPIPLLLQIFPKNKALGSSISILSFGLGSAIFVFLTRFFSSVINSFIYIGAIYGLLMLITSILLPKNLSLIPNINNNKSLTKKQALRTKEFYYIFIIIFINIFVGISLISVAAPLSKELLLNSAWIVATIGIFNGLGRPLWAFLADKINYINIYKLLFVVQIIAMIILSMNISWIIPPILFILGSTYGGGFSCLPALVSYIFGDKYAGIIFGTILFAWALAGLIGPFIITQLSMHLGSYLSSLIILSGLYIIALILSYRIKKLV